MYKNSLIDFIRDGGYQFMLPLIVLSILSLAIILERIWFLWQNGSLPVKQFDTLKQLLIEHNIEGIEKSLTLNKTLFNVIMRETFAIIKTGNGKISFGQAVEKSAEKYTGWLAHRFWLLKAIAHLSPLIGLLGTVVGLSISFGNVADSGLNQQSVASGIAMALITTIAGLIIALPTTLAECCLRAWAKARFESMKHLFDDMVMWYSL